MAFPDLLDSGFNMADISLVFEKELHRCAEQGGKRAEKQNVDNQPIGEIIL